MMCSALFTVAWTSNEKRASTSVETLPGMMFRISLPNSTSSRSSAASTCSSTVLPYKSVNHLPPIRLHFPFLNERTCSLP